MKKQQDGVVFPSVTDDFRVRRLAPRAGRLRMVLDTDAYNEIDDQFAIVHALSSPDRLNVEAIYAAPFMNDRAENPALGMERSYEEILRLLDRLGRPAEGLVHRGSTGYLPDGRTPRPSAAAEDLVRRGMAGPADEPLYVVAIGAITNVASALLMEPRLTERIVVVWLGGHAPWWPDTREFNLQQDIPAVRVVFDGGVPLVQLPCMGVVSHLHTSVPELEATVAGRGAIGDYLVKIVREHHAEHFCWSKVIWDIAATAYLVNDAWVPTALVPSPIVTDQKTYSADARRPLIRQAWYVRRDEILRDFCAKLPRPR
jgi:inosine-uridine nucleoside N-ribohydrolase